MRKKIVFVTKQLIMGGIEKSLISMLEDIPKDKYDVTLMLMERGGELLGEVPEAVRIKYLFGKEKTSRGKMWNNIKQIKLVSAFKVGFYTYLLKKGPTSGYVENMYYSKMLSTEKKKYDVAIAYYIPTSLPVTYVIKNIHAKRKIAWIHGDVTEYKQSLPTYKNIYEQYDTIFGVSRYTVDEFGRVFPNLRKKTSLFYNLFDTNKIQRLTNGKTSYLDRFEGIKILTVGRLETEKGQDIIPVVLSKLLSKGYDVRWYLIGEGGLALHLEQEIIAHDLKDHLILLGTKDNPYPFIRDCDIYVQPSRHEAYCLTVAEARIFNRPIITTKTGASEQITHEKTGLMIDFDEKHMYSAIKRLLDHPELRKEMIENLKEETIDTTNEMKKLYEIVDEIS